MSALRKIATWLPVTDEMIVDAGIGSAEDQAAAAARIRARQVADRIRWRALPLRVRLWRSHRWRLVEARWRILTAFAVLRGRHECDR